MQFQNMKPISDDIHPRSQPVILTFNKFYLPGYRAGGPIRTLANMVDRLGDSFDFRIVTLDRDAGDTTPYPGIEMRTWRPIGKGHVMYLSSEQVTVSLLTRIAREVNPDVVYLNSFFDPIFTQRMLWARRFGRLPPYPFILAPRGEFSAGALQLKRAKKMAYLQVTRLLGLYRHLTWQASSQYELADIRRNLSFVQVGDIVEAINLPPSVGEDEVSTAPSFRKEGTPLRVCFLSRISPMKNLDFALQALAQVKSEVVFTIYGPKEVREYWEACEALISALPVNIRVCYMGELVPREVKAALSQHDLFLFPTRGENYGHVIHEALGAGLPVLISDQTPWSDVVKRKVGWVHSLADPVIFANSIDEFASQAPAHVMEVKRRAMAYAKECAVKAEALENNINLFTRALSSTPEKTLSEYR